MQHPFPPLRPQAPLTPRQVRSAPAVFDLTFLAGLVLIAAVVLS
jgi:hypothetical protein